MIRIPSHLIHSRSMSLGNQINLNTPKFKYFVSFKVLARESFRAFVDFTFFGTDQEDMLFEFVEIEAKTTSITNQRAFFISGFSNELKLDDFFRFELILHENPVSNSTIRTDGIEVVVLGSIRIPSNLPNGVSMLLGSHS